MYTMFVFVLILNKLIQNKIIDENFFFQNLYEEQTFRTDIFEDLVMISCWLCRMKMMEGYTDANWTWKMKLYTWGK